uniref:G_PROTEIN_RECEP_F1_2 domain-containing protein n=1 Tax=Caenorhabditis tropicalis TaxID=1561998 RepID=A0A1I7U2C9_9PELO
MSNTVIVFAVFIVTVISAFTLPKGCGYVYNPEYFQWIPEEDQCAETFSNAIMVSISTITLTSNIFNVATAARLLMSKMVGMTKQDSSRRRRRWMIMFVQKICLVKTVPNLIVCLSFLFWVIPLTSLRFTYDEVSHWMNSLLGQLTGTWAYLLTPILQVSMSCNRFYVLYFPFGIKLIKRFPMSNTVLVLAVFIVTVITASTFTLSGEGCGYVYNPEYFLWLPEDEDGQCAETFYNVFMVSISTITLTSNGFNIATGARLLMSKMVGISKQESSKRRKRWMMMFVQSVFQDCLQLFDTLNSYYIVLISDATWFQFRFVTLSLVTIAMLDGLAMFACHSDIHPNWIKKLGRKRKVSKPVSITVLGTISNVLVFLAAMRMSSMSSSFGIITKNQAICNTIMCLIFLLYVFPMQLSDSAFLIKYSHILGLAAMSIYEVSNLLHLLIAFNRFCAVFFSTHYENLFSSFGTIIMIQLVWIISFILCSIFYEFLGCYFSYDDVSWTFGFLASPKCEQLTWYTDFALNTTLIVITLFINLLTAFKAGKNSRMLMNAAGIQMSQRQKQREMGFIKQTFFQGISIFAGQFTYYLVAPFLTNSVLLFLVASLWAFMHAVEGGTPLSRGGDATITRFRGNMIRPKRTTNMTKEKLADIVMQLERVKNGN